MFNEEFFPTPPEVIDIMLESEVLKDKTVLEPSAGKGDIVDYLLNQEVREVLAVEPNQDLRAILATKCRLIGADFMDIQSDQVSHIDFIVMNPPFSVDNKHIRHAFEIAPPGCKIISLCNYESYANQRSKDRLALQDLVNEFGTVENLGPCFATAERDTQVRIGLIRLQKPGSSYASEFEGFFMEEEQEEQENGIMSYNVIRDLVNRYVGAVKIFDEQLLAAIKMNALIASFYKTELAMQMTEKGVPKARNDFKKEMQKSGWMFIFNKMNLAKYATKGQRDDINKFVETQTEVPFTMRNIYKMLEIVVGTTTQRMDKALLEVFDRVTQHHHENRHYVEGWKTNIHYLIGKKFILPNMCYQDQRWYKGESRIQVGYGGNFDLVEDLVKALCYISGDNYDKLGSLSSWMRNRYKLVIDTEVFYFGGNDAYDRMQGKKEELYNKGVASQVVPCEPVYGEWFDWAYFRVKCFKKGSMHFEFKDMDLWGRFNQRIARLKGYPLFEQKPQTAYQDRMAGRQKAA
jgi:hypothetical protein